MLFLKKDHCAVIAGMARGFMPRHRLPAQPRITLAFDRHGDVVELEMLDLRNLQRKGPRSAPAPQLNIQEKR